MASDTGNRPSDKVTPLRKPRPCPECGAPSARETFPFCSARCKSTDLNRWLTGAYVIASIEEDEDDKPPEENVDDEASGR